MAIPPPRVWRAAPATLAVVGLFCVAAGVCIPVLAYLVLLREQSPALPVFLAVLAVFALGYGWRFGLHPSLRADERGVIVTNPGRRVRFGWSEINVLAPGENGLVVGSESDRAEVWCIQKSRWATRRGRRTRADRIVDELCECGTPVERIMPVVNHAPRHPAQRSEMVRALRSLTVERRPIRRGRPASDRNRISLPGAAAIGGDRSDDATAPPVFIRSVRMLEDIHRSAGPLPDAIVSPLVGAVSALLARLDRVAATVESPFPVRPGELGVAVASGTGVT